MVDSMTRSEENKKEDTALIEEILTLVRYHFKSMYTGYDTWIDRTNLIEHVHDICAEDVRNKERYNYIKRILED